MREKYYNFIGKNNILDILTEIDELSFSAKLSLIESLYTKFGTDKTNYALYEYKKNYMDSNRVELKKLKNVLNYFCKLYEKKR